MGNQIYILDNKIPGDYNTIVPDDLFLLVDFSKEKEIYKIGTYSYDVLKVAVVQGSYTPSANFEILSVGTDRILYVNPALDINLDNCRVKIFENGDAFDLGIKTTIGTYTGYAVPQSATFGLESGVDYKFSFWRRVIINDNTTNTNTTWSSQKINTKVQTKEDKFLKNTAFNKDFGVLVDQVARGNHSHKLSDLDNDSGFITGVSNITEIPLRSYNNLQDLPTLYDSADFDADLIASTTDDLSEGATNLYNRQADWEQANISVPDYIKNKPTNVTSLSVRNVNDIEEFKITDVVRFKGMLFDAANKTLSTEVLQGYSVFVDVVNGNDNTAELENSNKPFKDFSTAVNSIPSGQEFWNVYLIGTTIPVTRRLIPKNINFISFTGSTLDFSAVYENDGVTLAEQCFANDSACTLNFEGTNVSMFCSTVEKRHFHASLGGTDHRSSRITLKGTINNFSWVAQKIQNHVSALVGCSHLSNFKIKHLFSCSSGLFGGRTDSNNGGITLEIDLCSTDAIIIGSNNTPAVLPYNVTINSFNSSINVAGSSLLRCDLLKIGNCLNTIDPITINTQNCTTVEFLNSSLSSNITIPINSATYKGTIIGDAVFECSYSFVVTFENFIGKIKGDRVHRQTKFTFINSDITITNGYLCMPRSMGDASSAERADFIDFIGINTVKSLNNYSFLIAKDSYSGADMTLGVNREININGALYLGTGVYYSQSKHKFKVNYSSVGTRELKNQIPIKTKQEIINKELSSEVTYVVDGILTLEEGETIIVPVGGLSIKGYSFDSSKLRSNATTTPMFTSPTGGSGNLIMSNLEISAYSSQVFDVTDVDGTHAIETDFINYIACASLGVFNGYRQFTGTTCGLYGCSDGLQLEGSWNGFKLSNSNMFGFGATGTVFKKGTTTSFANRVYLELNVSLPTGAILLDFDPTNFQFDNLLQINSSILQYNNTQLDSNAEIVIPNIGANNPKCLWRSNVGLPDTAVEKIVDTDVAGAFEVDWFNDTFNLNMTADTTFTDINLPASGKSTKEIQLYISGNFTPTFPTDWNTNKVGTFKAGELNKLTLKFIKNGSYFLKIDNSLTIYPAPDLKTITPVSLIPNTTDLVKLTGSFFTPASVFEIEGQTVQSIDFLNSNEVDLNVTTGDTEGAFDIRITNGTLRVFVDKFLVILGTVFIPSLSNWYDVTVGAEIADNGERIKNVAYGQVGSGKVDFDILINENFSVRFNFGQADGSPTVPSDGANNFLIYDSVTDSTLFDCNTRSGKYGAEWNEYSTGTKTYIGYYYSGEYDNWGDVKADVQELRYVDGIFYIYCNYQLRKTLTVFQNYTNNLRIRFDVQTVDFKNIKYIKLNM